MLGCLPSKDRQTLPGKPKLVGLNDKVMEAISPLVPSLIPFEASFLLFVVMYSMYLAIEIFCARS